VDVDGHELVGVAGVLLAEVYEVSSEVVPGVVLGAPGVILFEQVGALVGSFSTNASSSAQEIAALEDVIRAQNVPAVFVGTTVNSALAEQVAQDTGTQIVPVYTGSLTAPGGEADSYLAFMRYNVSAIVEALT